MNGSTIILSATLQENPISKNSATLAISTTTAVDITCDVSTTLGQTLLREPEHLNAGVNEVLLPLGIMPSGVYYLRIVSGTGEVRSLQLIKQD